MSLIFTIPYMIISRICYFIFHILDGSDNPKGKIYRLNMKYTEIGTDRNMLIQVGYMKSEIGTDRSRLIQVGYIKSEIGLSGAC